MNNQTDKITITLNEYLKNNKITKKEIVTLVEGLQDIENQAKAINTNKNYINGFILDPDRIKIYKDTGYLHIYYDHTQQLKNDFYYDVSKLMIKILRSIDVNDKEALSLGFTLCVRTSKDDFKIKDLKEAIDELDEKVNYYEKEAVKFINEELKGNSNVKKEMTEEEKVEIYNKDDYEKLTKFAKKLNIDTLEELQSILIQCEYDEKFLSDFASAIDNTYVNKNNEVVIKPQNTVDNLIPEENLSEKIHTFQYKNKDYIIPKGLQEIIYNQVKADYQMEFMKELRESKLPEYSFLRTLSDDQLYSLGINAKNLEEDFAVNDSLPEAAVKEKIKDWLLNQYEGYTQGNMLLHKALEKSLEDKPIENQISILRNKIAQIKCPTPQAPTQKNVPKP